MCTNVAVLLYVRDTTTYFFAQKNHKVLAKQKIILGLASITSLRMRIYLVCVLVQLLFLICGTQTYDKDLHIQLFFYMAQKNTRQNLFFFSYIHLNMNIFTHTEIYLRSRLAYFFTRFTRERNPLQINFSHHNVENKLFLSPNNCVFVLVLFVIYDIRYAKKNLQVNVYLWGREGDNKYE